MTLAEGAAIALGLAVAYLIGGIPVAYIVGRVSRGIDIREHGSGNVGTTNAWRVLGPVPGVIVLVLDVAKGALAVVVSGFVLGIAMAVLAGLGAAQEWGQQYWLTVLAGLAAILGHTYTPFLRFQGGKGIATAAGVLLVLTPLAVVILLGVFVVVVAVTRMVSAGSVVIALLFPPLVWLLYRDVPGMVAFSVVAAALVVWRHRGNISRMARGEERRVTWRKGSGEGRGER